MPDDNAFRPLRSSSSRPALRRDRRTAALLTLIALAVLGSRQAQAFGDPDQGHELATAWCSGCHQVDPRAQVLATDAVPSFRAIAAMPSTTSLSIQVFLRTSHDVMPNFQLTEPQIDNVGAYILEMRARPTK